LLSLRLLAHDRAQSPNDHATLQASASQSPSLISISMFHVCQLSLFGGIDEIIP
jgi:hypothetical protein